MIRKILAAGSLVALLLAGCAADALLVADPYWAPILQAEPGGPSLEKKVKKETRLSLAILQIPPGAPAAELLEDYLKKKSPQRIILGAFGAVDLESLARRRQDIRFFCLDAPPEPPPSSPYVWVRFDPRSALDQAATVISRYAEDEVPEENPPAAFLDRDLGAMFYAAAEARGLVLEVLWVDATGPAEGLRSQVRQKMANRPPLAIVLAGTRTGTILELLRQQDSPGVFTLGARSFPTGDPLQVEASVEKDYLSAIMAALTSQAGAGELLEVPMILTGKLFDKGK